MWFISLTSPLIVPSPLSFVFSSKYSIHPCICPFAHSFHWLLHSKLVTYHQTHSWRKVNLWLYASTQGNCGMSCQFLGKNCFLGTLCSGLVNRDSSGGAKLYSRACFCVVLYVWGNHEAPFESWFWNIWNEAICPFDQWFSSASNSEL